jgi:hypothetical protein
MQLLDVLGQMLLERIRHELLQLGSGLHRHFRLREQHLCAADQHGHTTSRSTRGGERQRSALRWAERRPARIDHEPGRELSGLRWQAQQKPVRHRRILSSFADSCSSTASLWARAGGLSRG